MTKTRLDYYDGKDKLPKNSFKISPSQFHKFLSKPHEWFREQVLGESDFQGNTSTVLGTIVHYVAECVGKGEEVDKTEIEKFLNNQKDNPDVDIEDVRENYKPMAEALVNGYILKNKPTIIEDFVIHDLGDNVFVAGSVDNATGTKENLMIVDYKTYNSKTKPKSIPLHYKYQLLLYANAYRAKGYNVDRIRLVYVSKPIDGRYISEKTGKQCGKIHPAKVTVLTEEVTQEDFDFINSVTALCKETYLKAKEDESLVYLLYKDYRLKGYKW